MPIFFVHPLSVFGTTLGWLGRAAEDVDPLALGEADDGALGVLALAVAEPGPLALAGPVERVHVRHLDAEHRLDGLLDLRLVGVGADHERVLVLVQQPVALLRDDRRDDDVAGVGDLVHGCDPPYFFAAREMNSSYAFCVKTTSSFTSTS